MEEVLQSFNDEYDGIFHELNKDVYRLNGYLYLRFDDNELELGAMLNTINVMHLMNGIPAIEIIDEGNRGGRFYCVYVIGNE